MSRELLQSRRIPLKEIRFSDAAMDKMLFELDVTKQQLESEGRVVSRAVGGHTTDEITINADDSVIMAFDIMVDNERRTVYLTIYKGEWDFLPKVKN